MPLAIFGPENYGYRLGLIGAPARFLQAGAPLGFALLIDHIGGDVLLVSSALSLSACLALCLLRAPGRAGPCRLTPRGTARLGGAAGRRRLRRAGDACRSAPSSGRRCCPSMMRRWTLTQQRGRLDHRDLLRRLHGLGAGAGHADRPDRRQARLSVRRRLLGRGPSRCSACSPTASGRRWPCARSPASAGPAPT